MCSGPSAMANKPTSINDLPDDILLEILSYFGLEVLCFNISKVCERWKLLIKDVILCEKLSYCCDHYSHMRRIHKVRYSTLLGFRTN